MEPIIIAETEELIALNKPSGLIVHSDGRTEEPSLAEWLIARHPYLAEVGEPWLSPQGENVRIGGVLHRLDRATSGVVLAAKNNEAWGRAKAEFKSRSIAKIYLAYVYGSLVGEGNIIAEIERTSEAPRRWYARPTTEDDVRAAITHWRALHTAASATLLELSPKTGRTHQLRVHLASIGHSIIADHLYAPERAPLLGFTRLALHASSITIWHETFEAPLPEDFQNAASVILTT